MFGNRLSRRRFFSVSAAAMVAASCSTNQQGQRGSRRKGGERDKRVSGDPGTPPLYNESPILSSRVEAGELPPVKERLPREPYVVRPGVLVDEQYVQLRPGQYGGTMQVPQEAPSGDPSIFIGLNEPLIWAPEGFDFGRGIEGNVVAGYEASTDNTEFVFHMRPGLRWSDGEPVTMEDVEFAFDEVLYNREITPVFPLYLRAGLQPGSAPAKLHVIDDSTFSLKFDRPYGVFPTQLAIAQWRGYAGIIKPKHYLEQFHKKYADPGQLREKLHEASLPESEWFNLFNAKQLTEWMWNMTTEQSIGHPTLTPWVLKEVRSSAFTYERNPYYFKVDSKGNQLPYIDDINSQVVQDKESLSARALMGEFDFPGERGSLRELSLLAKKADRGEIKLFVYPKHTILVTFFLNLTHEDENWRKVVRDLRFREALSLAINRKEIIENFYLGEFAKLPAQTNPAAYDVDEANRLLDDMGLDRRDEEGYRLGPDGERFQIPFEIFDHSEDYIPMSELVSEYWKNIDVFTTMRQIDATLAGERAAANELKAGGGPLHYPIWSSAGWDDYLPYDSWGPLWQEWYTSQGKGGEEPPEEVKKLFEHHESFMSSAIGSPENRTALNAIVKSFHDDLWRFTPVEGVYSPTFWTSRVKNVPQGVKEDVYGIVATYSMEQWYMDG